MGWERVGLWDTRLTFPSSHLPSFPLIKKGKSNLTDADRAADRQTPMGEWLKEGGRDGSPGWAVVDQMSAADIPFPSVR